MKSLTLTFTFTLLAQVTQEDPYLLQLDIKKL